MIARLARPEALFAVAVIALVVAAAATVASGPPVALPRGSTASPRASLAGTPLPGPTGQPPVLAIASSSRVGFLYAVVGDENARLLRTTDGGLKWSVVNARLPAVPSASRGLDELIADPVTPGAFYLVRGATIYRFTDEDTTLRAVPTPVGARGDPFTGTYAIPPWQEGTIFRQIQERGIARTYDGGRTWVAMSLPGPVKALAAAPSVRGMLYAFSKGVIWESTDDGEKWYSRSPADPLVFGTAVSPSLTVHPRDQYRLFAGTAAGLYVSVDGGDKWKLAWTDPSGTAGDPIWRFAFDTLGFTVYASRLSPLYADNPTLVSRDRGQTWQESRLRSIGARQVIFTGWPDAPSFVGTTGRGVYVGNAIAEDLKPRSEGLAPTP